MSGTKLFLRRLNLSGLALLAILALGLVAYSVLAPALLSSWRLDMTANQQYTLSAGSREILKNLPQTIKLKLYFSETASRDLPQIRQYADDVWNILQEMRQLAKGKLKLEKIDPEPFSEAEDDAVAIGLQAVPLASGEQLFFGLVAGNELDGFQIMPFLQPDKALFLEYDLAKMISSLADPEPRKVGWLSELPAIPKEDVLTGHAGPGWEIYRQLEQLYTLVPIDPKVAELPRDLDLLVLAAPRDLAEALVADIEQFVLGGGRLILFLDPLAERLPPTPDAPSSASGLESLLDHWGISFNSHEVVADLEYALKVSVAGAQKPVRHLSILGIHAQGMNQDDIVSADLDVVNLSSSGHLRSKADAMLLATPLLQSSENAGLLDVKEVSTVENPELLGKNFVASGQKYLLAARFQGLPTALYPLDNKAEATSDTAETTHDIKADVYLSVAADPVQIIVFADSDLLDDRFWVRQQAFFQQSVSSAFADNGNLVVNAVDNLLGSEALISIRAKEVTQRPFSRVDKMRFAAELKLQTREQDLQAELEKIESHLSGMQQTGEITTPEQQAEIQQFNERRLQTRKQLRQVQQSLNKDIRQLGTTLKVINIMVLPGLVALLSLLYFWRRRKVA